MMLETQLTHSTLGWVKHELDATLSEAKEALEAHVEDAGDGTHIGRCVTCLHQVQGTLRIVELHGAGLVAEEMEQVARACAQGTVNDKNEAYGVLMRGIVQLPDYLDHVASGQRDVPIILLALLNDLRTVRGGDALAESTLFSPELTVELPPEAKGPGEPLEPQQLKAQAARQRLAFQGALVHWFKGKSPGQALRGMQDVLMALVDITHTTPARRLWWIAAALVDGMAAGVVETGAAVKKHMGGVDRQIKRLVDDGEEAFEQDVPDNLARALLYYIAYARDCTPSMASVHEAFRLAELMPEQSEMEQAQGAMSGHNRDLLMTVGAAIKEDLLQVKDALDLYLRTSKDQPTELHAQADALGSIADTLGMLGLGEQRHQIQARRETLAAMAVGTQHADEATLMEVAEALLVVEGFLDDYIDHLGVIEDVSKDDEDASPVELPRAEMQRIKQTLLNEAAENLHQAKEGIVAFIEAPWNHELLSRGPGLIEEVIGALRMFGADEVADLLRGVVRYLKRRLIEPHGVPDQDELEILADALEGLEYYLGGLGDHRPRAAEALDLARDRVAQLAAAAERMPEVQEEAPPESHLSVVDMPAEEQPTDRRESGASVTDLGDETVARDAAGFSDDIDDEIRAVFVEEVTEELDNLRQLYPKWKADNEDTDTLVTMRRVFHTLKGSGRLVGALTIGEFSWTIENLLNRILDGTREATPAVFGLMDVAIGKAMPELLDDLQGVNAINIDLDAIKATAEALARGEEVELPAAITGEAPAARALDDTLEIPIDEPESAQPTAFDTAGDEHADHLIQEALAAQAAADETSAAEEATSSDELEADSGEGASLPAMEPGLYQVFQKEAQAHLLTLSAFLDHARPHPEKTPVNEELARSLHTLYGAAAMSGVGPLADLTGPMESYVKRLQVKDDYLSRDGFEALESGLQQAETIVEEAGGSAPNYPDVSELAQRLNELGAGGPEDEVSEAVWAGEAVTWDEDTETAAGDPLEAEQASQDAAWEPPLAEDGTLPETEDAVGDVETGADVPEQADEVVQQELAAAADESESDETVEEERAVAAEATQTFGVDDDDLDRELQDIFLQEARELLDETDGLMQRWRANPADAEASAELQRDLHTLKGGARMVELDGIGDLGHALESIYESINNGQLPVSEGVFEQIEAALDNLHRDVETAGRGERPAYPEQAINDINALLGEKTEAISGFEGHAQADTEAPAQPRQVRFTQEDLEKAEVAQRERALVGQQEMVRVRADLMDNLVNYAGEVSIYRGRLEQQVGAFRFNLVELEQTVTRLREQLRKLEIETEAQILSRLQREGVLPEEAELDLERFDPLELDRFSQLQQYSRALAESVTDLVNIEDILSGLTRESETLLLQQSRINSDLQEGLMRTRMVPFSSQVPRLRRLMRRTADELGRKARLEVSGAEGEMDRTVLERMAAPLDHMLRNALAHGIETPEERKQAGKPEEGVIHINLRREASEVVMEVGDDGRGIDLEAVRKIAIKRGLLKEGTQLSDHDTLAFILETGFSTAGEVSQVAGRGVGMDVVHAEIKQLSGSLDIDSRHGKGTTFTVRLPFTLAVTQALMVRVGDENYAVPLSGIEGVVRVEREEFMGLLKKGEEARLSYGGEDYEVQDLAILLGRDPHHVSDQPFVPVLVVRAGDRHAAIRVDELLGSREVVVKSVGPQLSTVPGIFGATILGDGSVILILDLLPLARRGAAMKLLPEEMQPSREAAERDVRPTVMVVDDSITMRKVTGRILERHDMQVLTAKDGVDAVALLQEGTPDLMLLDIEMPRMDGYELATHMRNDSRLKGIPIIMITSRTGAKHRERAEGLGVKRYMGKPYQEADLMQNINELLGEEQSVD